MSPPHIIINFTPIFDLLQVARRGAKLGMPAPMLIQLEREIDREILADKRKLGFQVHK